MLELWTTGCSRHFRRQTDRHSLIALKLDRLACYRRATTAAAASYYVGSCLQLTDPPDQWPLGWHCGGPVGPSQRHTAGASSAVPCREGGLQQGASIRLPIGSPPAWRTTMTCVILAHRQSAAPPPCLQIHRRRLCHKRASLREHRHPSAKQSVSSVIVAPRLQARVWQERLANQSESNPFAFLSAWSGPRKTGLPEEKEIAHRTRQMALHMAQRAVPDSLSGRDSCKQLP